jgi:membrane associated rhomboid family serine protease
MDEDVLRLADPEDPISGLILYRRIPPSGEVHHMVGGRDRQTDTACLRREDHDVEAIRFTLEYVDHLLARQTRNATIDPHWASGECVACFYDLSEAVLHGQIWQLFTYSFLHADVMHLVLNLLVLAFVGSDIEAVWGRKRFLTYYFYCSIMAGIFYLLVQILISNPLYLSLPMVGASGGIYGLLLAYGILFPDRELLLMMLFPMKAKQFVWVLAGIEFLQALFSGQGGLGAFAHVSGMGAGFLYLYFQAKGFQIQKRPAPKKKASHLRLVKDSKPEDDDRNGPKTWH